MTVWLSVVMPVHGGANMLGMTLASVVAEHPHGVELRLYNSADDGGAAQAVAQTFAHQLDIVWQEKPDLKPWTAKTNLGVIEARAPHVVMLHQDDLWLPGHLDSVRKSIATAGDTVMSVATSRYIGPVGQDLGPWRLPFAPGRYGGREFAETLIVQNSIAIPSPVIARDAWLKSGGLDDALWFSADWDLYLKLAELGDVVVRSDPTTGFRLHGGSLTMTGSRDLRDYRQQLEIVLARHNAALAPLDRAIVRRAKVAIAANHALAAVWHGQVWALPGALLQVAGLGPRGMRRWLAETGLIDRVRTRLRLALAGAL